MERRRDRAAMFSDRLWAELRLICTAELGHIEQL